MGARVYLAKIGRFLQVDPVEGGVENNYVYPPDPVNDFDLDGNFSFSISTVTKIASVGSMLPGPLGMICSGVAAAGYAAQGDYKSAALYTAGIALAAVGAGAAVNGIRVAAKSATIASNAARGAKAEKFAFALAHVRHPLSSISMQQVRKTPLGVRRIDILVKSRVTGKLTAIEVKAGNSRYHLVHRNKDSLLRSRGYNTKLWRLKWL